MTLPCFTAGQRDFPFAMSGTQREDLDDQLEQLPLILDLAAAEAAWDAYQESLIDEQPFTFLYNLDRLSGVNRRIRGEVLDIRGEWVNLKDWWIPSDERRRGAR